MGKGVRGFFRHCHHRASGATSVLIVYSRKETAMAEEEIEVTDADVARFQKNLEQWSQTLDPQERRLLHLGVRAVATDADVVGFEDGAPSIDLSAIIQILSTGKPLPTPRGPVVKQGTPVVVNSPKH
jgi:hypothetical protein